MCECVCVCVLFQRYIIYINGQRKYRTSVYFRERSHRAHDRSPHEQKIHASLEEPYKPSEPFKSEFSGTKVRGPRKFGLPTVRARFRRARYYISPALVHPFFFY